MFPLRHYLLVPLSANSVLSKLPPISSSLYFVGVSSFELLHAVEICPILRMIYNGTCQRHDFLHNETNCWKMSHWWFYRVIYSLGIGRLCLFWVHGCLSQLFPSQWKFPSDVSYPKSIGRRNAFSHYLHQRHQLLWHINRDIKWSERAVIGSTPTILRWSTAM